MNSTASTRASANIPGNVFSKFKMIPSLRRKSQPPLTAKAETKGHASATPTAPVRCHDSTTTTTSISKLKPLILVERWLGKESQLPTPPPSATKPSIDRQSQMINVSDTIATLTVKTGDVELNVQGPPSSARTKAVRPPPVSRKPEGIKAPFRVPILSNPQPSSRKTLSSTVLIEKQPEVPKSKSTSAKKAPFVVPFSSQRKESASPGFGIPPIDKHTTPPLVKIQGDRMPFVVPLSSKMKPVSASNPRTKAREAPSQVALPIGRPAVPATKTRDSVTTVRSAQIIKPKPTLSGVVGQKKTAAVVPTVKLKSNPATRASVNVPRKAVPVASVQIKTIPPVTRKTAVSSTASAKPALNKVKVEVSRLPQKTHLFSPSTVPRTKSTKPISQPITKASRVSNIRPAGLETKATKSQQPVPRAKPKVPRLRLDLDCLSAADATAILSSSSSRSFASTSVTSSSGGSSSRMSPTPCPAAVPRLAEGDTSEVMLVVRAVEDKAAVTIDYMKETDTSASKGGGCGDAGDDRNNAKDTNAGAVRIAEEGKGDGEVEEKRTTNIFGSLMSAIAKRQASQDEETTPAIHNEEESVQTIQRQETTREKDEEEHVKIILKKTHIERGSPEERGVVGELQEMFQFRGIHLRGHDDAAGVRKPRHSDFTQGSSTTSSDDNIPEVRRNWTALTKQIKINQTQKENINNELQEVYRRRAGKATAMKREPTSAIAIVKENVIDQNVAVSETKRVKVTRSNHDDYEVAASAFGPRKGRRIMVPPLAEGAVSSHNERIQMELRSLRAQKKVQGGSAPLSPRKGELSLLALAILEKNRK